MALVVGRYEGLFKPERNMTSEGKQSFLYSYNKGHKSFIIPKLHTQQQSIFLN